MACASSDMGSGVLVEFFQRQPANRCLTILAVARVRVERRKQVERDIRRLIMPQIGMRDVMAERTYRRLAREWTNRFATRIRRSEHPGYKPGRDRFHIPLDP